MSGARSGVPSSGIHPSASHTHADQWLTRMRIEKKRAVSATYELTEYRTCGMVERVARGVNAGLRAAAAEVTGVRVAP